MNSHTTNISSDDDTTDPDPYNLHYFTIQLFTDLSSELLRTTKYAMRFLFLSNCVSVCFAGVSKQASSITCLLVDDVHCVGVNQIYAPSFMFPCQPCLCLPSKFPILTLDLWANTLAGRAARFSSQLASSSAGAQLKDESIFPHNQSHLLIEPICLICPLHRKTWRHWFH